LENDMDTSEIRVQIRDQIAFVEFFRPGRKNSVTPSAVLAMTAALKEIRSQTDVRVLVMGGGAEGFCAGADLMESVSQIPRGPDADLVAFLEDNYHNLIRTMVDMPMPTIAAIRGGAVGFGFSVALACDFRVVAENCKFGPSFTRLGMTTDGGCSFFLPRLVGVGRALDIIYNARLLNGKEALAYGLAHDCVPDDDVMERVQARAEQLRKGPPNSFKHIRNLVYDGLENDLNTVLLRESDIQAARLVTPDVAEGVMAFFERRTPRFLERSEES